MEIFISYPQSTRDTHISPRAFGPRADMGVSGWYGVWYENCHIIYKEDSEYILVEESALSRAFSYIRWPEIMVHYKNTPIQIY